MEAAKRRLISFIVSLVIAAVILGVFVCAVYLSLQPEAKAYSSQPFADAFSGVNALFAGCAFGGVVYTIWLQINDLNDTKSELKKTAEANSAMARANVDLARIADERTVLEMFQTYCSEYFQIVKDSSMSVLIPCVASKEYCEFVASRFFVAGQLDFPTQAWEKVSRVSYCKSLEEFIREEQRYRYKLDELINFFTLLVGRSNAGAIVARCDVSYSWWRPLLWLIAKAQQEHFDATPIVRQYATPIYLKDTLGKLDEIYGFDPFVTDEDFWNFFLNHPKVRRYGLDDAYFARAPMKPVQGLPEPAVA